MQSEWLVWLSCLDSLGACFLFFGFLLGVVGVCFDFAFNVCVAVWLWRILLGLGFWWGLLVFCLGFCCDCISGYMIVQFMCRGLAVARQFF